MKKIIPIFFSFDNNYVIPAAVAFFSLLNKTKISKNGKIIYDMYVLHSDITIENQKLLLDIIKRFENNTEENFNNNLTFIDTKNFLKEEWENGNFCGYDKFTLSSIVKCFASKFFPQYDKIIYSDVDIVFEDDISEIFDIDLEGKYIAGVKDAFMKYVKSELVHLNVEYYEKLKDSYIAGGIWVMNLKKIREDDLESKMIEIINNHNLAKKWPDQDIINIVCDNKIGFIPLNYISYPYLLELLKNPDFVSHYSYDELYDSIINPKIIHYANKKPWKDSGVEYSINWWTIFYYLKLPFTPIIDVSVLDFNKKLAMVYKYKKKYKKYKFLFLILLLLLIVLFCIVICILI